jgi:LruC domain-containing protein
VVDVKATLITEAMGAIYHNAFGFQMPILANLVKSVTGNSILHGQITLNANGTEASQTKAVIIAYDDAYDRIPSPGVGVGTNTEKGAPYVTPDTMQLRVTFSQPIAQGQLGAPPFNPFIILGGLRTREVHLPDMAPTDMAAGSGDFGTVDDDSKPVEGRFYKTKSNLPWALNLSDKFFHVYERQAVNMAYLHFNEWAESSGTLFPDWFKTTSPGYRDNAKIYSH